jgi:hypothetical protein
MALREPYRVSYRCSALSPSSEGGNLNKGLAEGKEEDGKRKGEKGGGTIRYFAQSNTRLSYDTLSIRLQMVGKVPSNRCYITV